MHSLDLARDSAQHVAEMDRARSIMCTAHSREVEARSTHFPRQSDMILSWPMTWPTLPAHSHGILSRQGNAHGWNSPQIGAIHPSAPTADGGSGRAETCKGGLWCCVSSSGGNCRLALKSSSTCKAMRLCSRARSRSMASRCSRISSRRIGSSSTTAIAAPL